MSLIIQEMEGMEIYDGLESGASFSQMALTHSDSETGINGGA